MFYMLERALELKEPLAYINRNTQNKEFKNNFLSKVEQQAIEDLKAIFKIFIKPSIRIQLELYINLNKGLIYIYTIYNKLEGLMREYQARIREHGDLVSYLYTNI